MNAHIFKKKQVTKSIISVIEDKIRDTKCILKEIFFINFNYLTDSTLVSDNLNYYYDACSEQLD